MLFSTCALGASETLKPCGNLKYQGFAQSELTLLRTLGQHKFLYAISVTWSSLVGLSRPLFGFIIPVGGTFFMSTDYNSKTGYRKEGRRSITHCINLLFGIIPEPSRSQIHELWIIMHVLRYNHSPANLIFAWWPCQLRAVIGTVTRIRCCIARLGVGLPANILVTLLDLFTP